MKKKALVLGLKSNMERVIKGLNEIEFIIIDRRTLDEESIDYIINISDGFMHNKLFDYVIASSEDFIALAGLLRSRYSLYGEKYYKSTIATNKFLMRNFCSNFVPCPKFWLSGKIISSENILPSSQKDYIVKPLTGSSAKYVETVTKEELNHYLNENNKLMLIEEKVSMRDEYHLDCIIKDGNILFSTLSIYDRPILQAKSKNRASINLPDGTQLHEDALVLANNLQSHFEMTNGVFHIEMYHTQDGFVLGEFGIRPPGAGVTDLYFMYRGVDFWKAFIYSQIDKEFTLPLNHRSDKYCAAIGICSSFSVDDIRSTSKVFVDKYVNLREDAAKFAVPSSTSFNHMIYVSSSSLEEIRTFLQDISDR
ncbi:acetyl-CoA carboxylase biotin carboxylase subunit family protein [Pantoea sp. PNA 03-3]|uniref:ATP-grasp domain-containing protein n=1 Tax=Pantoea sp. PNA 03-3 TaxID=2135460 RepID=UPI000D7533A8|nr:hypothetical protein [Pantoea sp. PNA 03-3]PXV76747.1 hypothetical protein C7433_102438 [Pantoea sp. PNA 03-3]